MFDAAGRVMGVTRRFTDGSKRIVRGHRAGLYMPGNLPEDLSSERLLVTEGASDAVAALDLGAWSVGRFSCSHGRLLLRDLLIRRRPRELVIVCDADGPGRDGASNLALQLLPFARCLKSIQPPEPFKDLRAWKQAGTSAAELQVRISDGRQLAVKVRAP